MTRSPSGSLGTHFQEPCTTLARLLEIRPLLGDPLKLTDHDVDVDIPSRAVQAEGGPLTAEDTELGAQVATNTLSITSGNNALNNETVTIGSKVYTFQTVLSPTNGDGNVLIGVDRSASLLNLTNAINLGSGSGTTYGSGTTAHPDNLTAIAPTQTSTTNQQISQSGGTVIGNMTNFSTVTGFGGTNADSFDGVRHPFGSRTSRAPAAGGPAYVGKDFGGSPARISQAAIFGSNNTGWWEGGGTLSLRMNFQLRASNAASFPGATGGTLLGQTGQFVNPVASGSPISPSKTVSSSDVTTEWRWVWVVMIEQVTNGQYIMGEVELSGSRLVTDPGGGEMGLEANDPGEIKNEIATTETLTNGSWATPTMTGGQDAKFNIQDGETVTIGTIDGPDKVYTFQDTLTDVDGNIKIGDTAEDSLDNLAAAINLDTGAGTKYAASTTIHPDVFATTNATGLFVTAKVAGTDSNGLTLSETLSKGEWETSETAGGEDGLYKCRPGFTASATMASSEQGTEGLEVEFPESADGILQTDILKGIYNQAPATLEYINWKDPTGGQMVLFGGIIGDKGNNDEKLLQFVIQGKFTRNRTIRVCSYGSLCRVDLGSPECGFDIDSERQEFTITTVTNQSVIETSGLDASLEDDYWRLGVVQFLTGDNTGVAVEVSGYQQTNGTIQLFLPAPLPLQVGDTGQIWPGCAKTIETCGDRYGNSENFRAEPFIIASGSGFGNR